MPGQASIEETPEFSRPRGSRKRQYEEGETEIDQIDLSDNMGRNQAKNQTTRDGATNNGSETP